jgi:hypothetical protein
MLTSDSTAALDAALAKAQGEFAQVTKDSKNPHFKTMFAGLDSVVSAVRGALSSNGVAYVQSVDEVGEGHHVVTTRIAHGGEWIRTTCPVMWEQGRGSNKAQAFGSGLTYARRYALMAAFGLAPEDDDGQGSTQPQPKRKPKAQQRQGERAPGIAPMHAQDFARLVEGDLGIPLAMLNRHRVEVMEKDALTSNSNEFHLAQVAKELRTGGNAAEVRGWVEAQS